MSDDLTQLMHENDRLREDLREAEESVRNLKASQTPYAANLLGLIRKGENEVLRNLAIATATLAEERAKHKKLMNDICKELRYSPYVPGTYSNNPSQEEYTIAAVTVTLGDRDKFRDKIVPGIEKQLEECRVQHWTFIREVHKSMLEVMMKLAVRAVVEKAIREGLEKVLTDNSDIRKAIPAEAPAGEEQENHPYECKVCGNWADENGEVHHGKGCYVVDSDGGGTTTHDMDEWRREREQSG